MEDLSHNLESREEALVNQEELSINRFNLFTISRIGIARSRAALKTALNNFLITYQSTCINQARKSILQTQQSNWKKWKAALQRLEKKICVRIFSRSKSEDQRHLLHFCFAKGLHCQTARLQKQHTHTHIRTDRDSNRRARATEAAAKRGDQGRGCAWAATAVVARREERREQGRGRAESRAEAAHGLSRSACAVVNSNNNEKSDNNNSRRLYS